MNYNQNQEGTAQQSQTPAAAESYYQQTPQNNYQFRNNNYYAELNGVQSRDTYIYVGNWAGLGDTWQSMHDTQ